MRRPTWTYFVSAGVLALLVVWKLTHRSEQSGEPTSVDATSEFVPAQVYGEGGLQVAAEVTPIAGGRRIVLRLEDGEATLTLFDPQPSSDPQLKAAFGKARLEAKDAKSGGAFVAAFARFIGAVERWPRIDPTPLVPLDLEYVRIAKADEGRPETTKLFLHARRHDAEVFFDLWPDGVRAAFLEKDELYRRDLVAILAETLRDGPPPRRTVEGDAHLASDTPLFAQTSPVAGSKDLADVVFVDDVLVAAFDDDDHTKILRWKDPALPPDTLETLRGDVLTMSASPKGGLVAIVLSGDGADAGATKTLMVVDVHSGALTPLLSDVDLVGQDQPPVWSPDGKQIAIGAKTIVRIVDVAKRAIVATASDHGLPHRWTTSGLLLRKDERTFLWFPTSGQPTEFDVPKKYESPDAHFTVKIAKDGIYGENEVEFEPSRDDDRDALADLVDEEPTWIGPHAMLIASDDLFALDVETMRLRHLTAQPTLERVVASSADGTRAILADASGALVFAR